jgi:hypothetical protein
VYNVLPGELLLFRAPSRCLTSTEAGPEVPVAAAAAAAGPAPWRDEDGVREFGPRYYAELFADLDVAAVVRLDAAEVRRRTRAAVCVCACRDDTK